MGNLTYRELFDLIGRMSEEELDMNVTIHTPNNDEYFAVANMEYAKADLDILDKGHPYLEMLE